MTVAEGTVLAVYVDVTRSPGSAVSMGVAEAINDERAVEEKFVEDAGGVPDGNVSLLDVGTAEEDSVDAICNTHSQFSSLSSKMSYIVSSEKLDGITEDSTTL